MTLPQTGRDEITDIEADRYSIKTDEDATESHRDATETDRDETETDRDETETDRNIKIDTAKLSLLELGILLLFINVYFVCCSNTLE